MDGTDDEDWTKHQGLVRLWANRVYPSVRHLGASREDLIAQGNIVLWQCMRPGKFDKSRGIQPATYIMRSLIKRTDRMVAAACGFATEKRHARHLSVDTVSISDTVFNDRRRPRFDPVTGSDTMDEIAYIIEQAGLTDTEIAVIGMWMDGITRQDMAEMLGITLNSVSWRINKAKRKLRAWSENAELDAVGSTTVIPIAVQCPRFPPQSAWPLRPVVLKVTDRGVQ